MPHVPVEQGGEGLRVDDLAVAGRRSRSGSFIQPLTAITQNEPKKPVMTIGMPGEEVRPARQPVPAVDVDGDEDRLEEERDALQAERDAVDLAEGGAEVGPQEPELERQDRAGDDADGEEGERHLRPALRERLEVRLARAQVEPVDEQDHRREGDPEAHDRDVHRERERLHPARLEGVGRRLVAEDARDLLGSRRQHPEVEHSRSLRQPPRAGAAGQRRRRRIASATLPALSGGRCAARRRSFGPGPISSSSSAASGSRAARKRGASPSSSGGSRCTRSPARWQRNSPASTAGGVEALLLVAGAEAAGGRPGELERGAAERAAPAGAADEALVELARAARLVLAVARDRRRPASARRSRRAARRARARRRCAPRRRARRRRRGRGPGRGRRRRACRSRPRTRRSPRRAGCRRGGWRRRRAARRASAGRRRRGRRRVASGRRRRGAGRRARTPRRPPRRARARSGRGRGHARSGPRARPPAARAASIAMSSTPHGTGASIVCMGPASSPATRASEPVFTGTDTRWSHAGNARADARGRRGGYGHGR